MGDGEARRHTRYHAAHAYVALGHRVSVIAAGEPDSGPDADSPNIAVRRLKPIAEPWWSRRIPFVGRYLRTVRHAVHSWRVSMAIARLDRTARIDVVEFPEVNAEGLFYVLRRRRAPVVIRCHTPHLLLKEGYSREECYFDFDLIWRMERMSIMRADAVTSPSRDLSGRVAEACGLPASQVATVPHPVPIIWSEDTGGTLEEHPLELLHVGRLERAKGVFTLVRAISIALARVPDLHVTFVGATRRTPSGERVDDVLRRMLSASGCLERVTFWGYVDQEHLSDFYARASMCVVPSELYESFSYTCASGTCSGKARHSHAHRWDPGGGSGW